MQALICRSLHAANGPSAQQPAQQQQQQQQEQQQQGQDGKRKRGAYTDWFKGGLFKLVVAAVQRSNDVNGGVRTLRHPNREHFEKLSPTTAAAWFERDKNGRLQPNAAAKEKEAAGSSYGKCVRGSILDSNEDTRTAKGAINTMLRGIQKTGGDTGEQL